MALLFFGFVNCSDVCPLALGEFKDAKRLLDADADRAAFDFVSLDGDRDNAERLRAYVGAFDPAFIGLHGDAATRDRIAPEYDLVYRKQDSGNGSYAMAHTATAFLIDREGRLRVVCPYGTPAATPCRAEPSPRDTAWRRAYHRGRSNERRGDSLMTMGERSTCSPDREVGHTPLRSVARAPWRGNLVYVAWLQALVATGGSLYFSEVLKLPPCVLCWYQRIAMYPLVAILTVAILLREARLRAYVLPLSLTGLAIAIYHNLLYYGVIPESIQPCTSGVSCTTRQIEWLGFITIPLMALVAFIVIGVTTACYLPEESNVQSSAKSD